MADEPTPAPPPAKATKRPEYLVRNNWNQVVSVTLADGSQLHIAARTVSTIPESQLSTSITALKAKGTLTVQLKK